ncbi:MAG: peptidase M16 [Acidobacteria bacterium]|nr:peptidase M16 [Acidobacteriota bacterium]|tara:strand:- start:1728 stop:3137 length:1410 start_codon:yes stop_codon:yes gene_type:complete
MFPSRLRTGRWLSRILVLTAVLIGLSAVPTIAQTGVRPAALDYQLYTLDNGLTVILSEDHSTPIVHLQLVYHVGSKNERPGRTGFAHLFEHMMFKGSHNVRSDSHLSLISQVGGDGNGYTTEDTTTFLETVPAQYLPLVLWLEADRMATLRIDERTFEAEREVVKEERRWRYEDTPFGLLTELMYDQAYSVHPYKHSAIGSMEDLEAASVEDVQEFYDMYYVPENATLVLVGDFETPRALALVKQYFDRVQKARRPVPRDIEREPTQTEERRVTLTQSQNWPLPTVLVAHHITYDGHPDAYPLHIAAKVLSDGQSSRIYRRLVYENQLAVSAFGNGSLIEDPNLFYAVSVVQPGRTTTDSEKALIGELDRLKTELISEQELQQAKNQFARDYVFGRLTVEQKASHLAHAAVIHDDVTTVDAEFDVFMSVSREDVRRVAQTYFTKENRLILTILPQASVGRSFLRSGGSQ